MPLCRPQLQLRIAFCLDQEDVSVFCAVEIDAFDHLRMAAIESLREAGERREQANDAALRTLERLESRV